MQLLSGMAKSSHAASNDALKDFAEVENGFLESVGDFAGEVWIHT
jgi:hypothetical protein